MGTLIVLGSLLVAGALRLGILAVMPRGPGRRPVPDVARLSVRRLPAA